MQPDYRTRFAPSPTGYLHLGHAYSALTAQHRAQAAGGSFLLRIEDTDTARCRPEFEVAIFTDLAWLGLDWPRPVLRQSENLARYAAALDRLIALGVCYPCGCTRGDIRAALSAPQEGAVQLTPDGMVYPGTCRTRSMSDAQAGDAVRLNMVRALDLVGDPAELWYKETGPSQSGQYCLSAERLLADPGDIVLARRDNGTVAYHLAVVVDDAWQGITEVVRGTDLVKATPLHRLLQQMLGLLTPVFHHHKLIRDDQGRRLAKRDDARALRRYRQDGATPQDIRDLLEL